MPTRTKPCGESVATKNDGRHPAQRPHDRTRQAQARLDRPHGRDGRRNNRNPRQPKVFLTDEAKCEMALETVLKDAVATAMGATIAEEVQEIVAKETRRALRDHEDQLTTLVRTAVAEAIAEMLNGKGDVK